MNGQVHIKIYSSLYLCVLLFDDFYEFTIIDVFTGVRKYS